MEMSVTEQDVLSAIKSCYDPEIPVNIVDLGLIYSVKFVAATDDKQDVTVDLTLTSQGCPEHVNISAQVKSRLEQLPGIANAPVNVVWTPAWTPQRLSPDARKQPGIKYPSFTQYPSPFPSQILRNLPPLPTTPP